MNPTLPTTKKATHPPRQKRPVPTPAATVFAAYAQAHNLLLDSFAVVYGALEWFVYLNGELGMEVGERSYTDPCITVVTSTSKAGQHGYYRSKRTATGWDNILLLPLPAMHRTYATLAAHGVRVHPYPRHLTFSTDFQALYAALDEAHQPGKKKQLSPIPALQ